jgi:hypothetical protein
MRVLHDKTCAEMRELNRQALTQQMRVLHEDVIDRITLLGEE